MADEKPDYKVYRSRPRLLRRREDERPRARACEELRAPDAPPPDYEVQRAGAAPARRRARARRRGPRRITPGRVLKLGPARRCSAGSRSRAVLFMVSAQIQRGDLAGEVGPQLDDGPYPLTGANTILVLGSDARTEGLASPAPAARAARTRSCCCGSAAAQRLALDPARHGRRHPRPRHQQDQRGVRVRRPGARDPDRQGVPRHRDQPRRRGELRELPAAHRRARRRHLQGRRVLSKINGGRRNGGTTLRLKRARRRSTATRRSRSPARARTCATRARTT